MLALQPPSRHFERMFDSLEKKPPVGDSPGAHCAHPEASQKPLYPARDYISGDAFEIVRCDACEAVFTWPIPALDELDRYYPQSYYRKSSGRRFPAIVEFLQRRTYASRARAVERALGGRKGRVIDVGCGPGWLLREFDARGWEAMGTELSSTAASFARDELKLNVESHELRDLKFPDRHFDAVTLWHVLEHMPEPSALLREISRVLKPGGVLLVGVPNWGSLGSRLSRSKWFQLDVPRHVNHFTAGRLKRELAAVGLEVRRQIFLAPEFDFFSFVQSILNRIGLRHNLLYNLLRGRGAKVMREDRVGWWQIPVTLALAVPLGLLSLPATLLAALIRQGGSMTFYARKAEPSQAVKD